MAKTSKVAVDTNAYGDGYVHRATRGINPVRPGWSFSFPFVGEQALWDMDTFLKQNATRGFWIKPPGEQAEVYVVCDEWAATFSDKNKTVGLVGSLTASFTRIFNPQPVSPTP